MRNADIFPSYHNILEAKKDCYPEEVQITETEARVNLQSSVSHLVTRLLKSPGIVLPTEFSRQKKCNLELEIKYGCDGASGQATFNQKFANSDSSDETIFAVSMVPLCLRVTDTKEVIWMNPHPGFPKRCSPILLMLAKETTERTKKEMKMIDDEIKNLKETNVETSNGSYGVTVDMKLTMVDGKVCHALSDTPATTNCYICGSKPTEMNNLKKVMKKPKNIENFQFGLSVLHAKIRFMECILHIAYRLDFCKWRVSSKEEKALLEKAKKRICAEFKEKLGLIIDQPKSGAGNSNAGNTARRFFENVEETAKITEVNAELIKKFAQILQMLGSSTKIPSAFFNQFAFETAELYVRLYPWYYMPSTVHKILTHGGEVMEKFILPIGQYSEEAAEARNKDIKRYRQENTRKHSRLATMTDLMHKLFESSDLYIADLRRESEKEGTELDSEILNSIKEYNLNQ